MRQGGGCYGLARRPSVEAMFGVWCLLCPQLIPPDAPDTAAQAGLGWTAPQRGGRNVRRVALVSPLVTQITVNTVNFNFQYMNRLTY